MGKNVALPGGVHLKHKEFGAIFPVVGLVAVDERGTWMTNGYTPLRVEVWVAETSSPGHVELRSIVDGIWVACDKYGNEWGN